MINKLKKLLAIFMRPSLLGPLLKGSAAGVEHIEALRHIDVATCIDVGANVGQFTSVVRYIFPKATVIAFEPLPAAADLYADIWNGARGITLHRVALGAKRADGILHVTNRTDSSSLLVPGEGQRQAYDIHEVEAKKVPVQPLHEIVSLRQCERPVLMKIDVQGAELDVLAGCGDALDQIDAVYLEASFVELYTGQALAGEVVRYMVERGFKLRGVFNISRTHAFGATQADLLFCR